MKPCKCSKCRCELNITIPYKGEYVRRDTGSSKGWYHTDCLRKVKAKVPIDWDNIFQYTQDAVEELLDRDTLIDYIFNRYMLDWDDRALEESVCVLVEKAHKGNLYYKSNGKKVRMKYGIDYAYLKDMLVKKKNELNKLNKKNLRGYSWFIWDLMIVIKKYSEGYRLPVTEECLANSTEKPIEKNSINQEKALVFNKDLSDDVLGDDL